MSLLEAIVPTSDPVQFRHLLPDGADGPTWDAPVAVYGRWERGSRQHQTPEGRVVTLVGTVYLPATVEPNVGDQVSRDGIDWRRIEVVDTLSWFDGTVMHHEVGVS